MKFKKSEDIPAFPHSIYCQNEFREKMKNFSDRDLDRPWSSEELAALSEGQLTKLAFLRDYKNFLFFLPAALVFYLISGVLGVFGKIVGWVGIVLFGAFALQASLNIVVTFVSFIGTPFVDKVAPVKNALWKLLQILISLGNLLIYLTLAFLVYAGIYDIKLHQYIDW